MTVEPRDVDTADVYKSGSLAGRLDREGDRVAFRYLREYLDDGATRPVAWTLPKADDPYVATGGSVPAYFAGLLPEGARLQAAVRAARTSVDDQFTLLVAVGGDAVGDVQVVMTGEVPAEPPVLLDEDAISSANLDVAFERATGPDALRFDPAALPGVQPKVSSAMRSAPLTTSRGPAILKLNPERGYPKLVENECFFLGVASDCGLRVPPNRLVSDAEGRTGLLIERFDRRSISSGLLRLPQEDACQVLGVYPAAKYRLKTEDALVALASASERGGGSARVSMLELLRLVAYSYAMGNGDLHGRNMSIGGEPGGRWRVTPAYDLVCTQPYLRWRDPMALDLYGRANKLTRSRIVDAGERLGVPARATHRMLTEIVAGMEPWLSRIDEIGFEPRATATLTRLLERRRNELDRD